MTQEDSESAVMEICGQIMRGLNCKVRLERTLGDDGE